MSVNTKRGLEQMEANKEGESFFPESMTTTGIILTLIFGIIVPVAAVGFDLWLRMELQGFDMLYMIGAMFLLPRTAYLYITIGSGIVTLFLWLFYFHKKKQHYTGFIGGILLFNALFYFAFGVMGVYRLLIIPVWLPPFCAVPVLLSNGAKSLKVAFAVIPRYKVILSAIAGAIFVVVLSLSIIRQPWEFIRHLPNANGANFSSMNLSHICLEGGSNVTFEGADFSFSNLSYSYFANCNLNMENTNMKGANLENSILSTVNFKNANLSASNLNNAEIYQVDFTGVDFRDASLGFHAQARIIMNDANLCGADLSNLKNIHGVYNWQGAKYDSFTLWPKDFDPNKLGMVLVQNKNETISE